jgi:hypothetical protein
MNKEAQLATMFITCLAMALFGWAIAFLSSTRARPNKSGAFDPQRGN